MEDAAALLGDIVALLGNRLLARDHAGGAIAASFMGYNLAKRFAKDKESFGKGRIEGVFAPETAAHAAGTSALLPMLALGIPGSAPRRSCSVG